MKNKNLLLFIIVVIIIILSGIGIGYFAYQHNLKNSTNANLENNTVEPNYENSTNENLENNIVDPNYEKYNENTGESIRKYAINDELIITEKGYYDGNNNSKIYANEEEIFEGNAMTDISKIIKLNEEDFIIQFAEIAEGTSEGSYLFYDKGKSYINLNEKTQLDIATVFEVNGNEITLVSSKLYLFLDLLCISGYKDEDVIEVTEKFEYKGKGILEKVSVVSQKTLKDLLKENTEYNSCNDVGN